MQYICLEVTRLTMQRSGMLFFFCPSKDVFKLSLYDHAHRLSRYNLAYWGERHQT